MPSLRTSNKWHNTVKMIPESKSGWGKRLVRRARTYPAMSHDKLLCMIYPRLKLLQQLLAENGVIFISIDDNELYNLNGICDGIFGTSCFVSRVIWQNNYTLHTDAKVFHMKQIMFWYIVKNLIGNQSDFTDT